jgi:hypothetical protein
MKKLSTTLLLIMLAFAGAYAQNNNLVVFSNNGEKFTLILNGVRQNATPETNVKVTGLNAANYKAKIIFEKKNLFDIDQNVYLMSGGDHGKDTEYTYDIIEKKGSYKLRWMSEAPINATAPAAANQTVVVYTTTDAVVVPAVTSTTTTTTTQTAPVTTTSTTTTGTTENVNVGMNVNGMGVNMNISINDAPGGAVSSSSTTTTTQSTTITTSSSTGTTATAVPVTTTATTTAAPASGCYTAMNDGDFTSAKSSIKSKSFEDSKMTLAKQIISNNCLSTAQVKEIMQMFSFEDTKLDLAKYAYNKTIDPNNYFKLNDAFTFESSIEELDAYIQKNKK